MSPLEVVVTEPVQSPVKVIVLLGPVMAPVTVNVPPTVSFPSTVLLPFTCRLPLTVSFPDTVKSSPTETSPSELRDIFAVPVFVKCVMALVLTVLIN